MPRFLGSSSLTNDSDMGYVESDKGNKEQLSQSMNGVKKIGTILDIECI